MGKGVMGLTDYRSRLGVSHDRVLASRSASNILASMDGLVDVTADDVSVDAFIELGLALIRAREDLPPEKDVMDVFALAEHYLFEQVVQG